MVRMFVRHPVRDYATWREHYDSFDEERRSMGVRGHGVLRSPDDPDDVTVWHDFDDEASARAFGDWDRLREAMRDAGVTGEPEIWYAKPA